MEGFKLDLQGIHEYQQNRSPYLLMDYVNEVVPGKSARGYRDFKEDEWFFKVHFPGDPNVPGMLQMEALVQMAALSVLTLPGNKGKVVYLISARDMKLARKILPGERMDIETTLNTWRRGIGTCSGKGSVEGELACKAEFTIVMPSILEEFKVSV